MPVLLLLLGHIPSHASSPVAERCGHTMSQPKQKPQSSMSGFYFPSTFCDLLQNCVHVGQRGARGGWGLSFHRLLLRFCLWQVKGMESYHTVGSQYHMCSYYPPASYLGQGVGTPTCLPQILASEDIPCYSESKARGKCTYWGVWDHLALEQAPGRCGLLLGRKLVIRKQVFTRWWLFSGSPAVRWQRRAAAPQ